MINFLLALPLSVYDFNENIAGRRLLFSGQAANLPASDGNKYSVICAPASSSRGIPAYLISFYCPAAEKYGRGVEVFTAQIRKDYWGRYPSEDWFSMIVDGAQHKNSFEYP